MNIETIIVIKDVEYKIKKSFGVLMEFERLTKLNSLNLEYNLNNTIMLFYATLKFNNKNFKYSVEDFIALIDEDENILMQYIDYLALLKEEGDVNDAKEAEKKS